MQWKKLVIQESSFIGMCDSLMAEEMPFYKILQFHKRRETY